MVENHACRVLPNTPYARLMEALNLPYEENKDSTHISVFSKLLDVRMSLLSDAIRRNGNMIAAAYDAVAAKGISREYLSTGQAPMYLPGWKRGPDSPSLPVKEAPPE